MSKEKISYGVVILNYNTSNDAIKAAKTVIKCSTNNNFVICITDNASTKMGEIEALKNVNLRNTEVLAIKSNEGYARGNNEGCKYLINKYNPDYLVIMNPDVQLLNVGTIERLIDNIDTKDYICGTQPLVWTPYKGNELYQVNIRNVPSFFDVLIQHNFFLKRIFSRRAGKYIYKDQMPFIREIEYYVPSGAFFIMKAKQFENLDFFDNDTFLYNEEVILGYKIKEKGYKMLFNPQEKVQHEGGKSIGSNSKRIKHYAVRFEKDSLDIYLTKYLKVGGFYKMLVHFVIDMDFFCKRISYFVR